MPTVVYEPSERAEAIIRLAINKYDYNKTAKELGVSPSTLRRWERAVPSLGIEEYLERAIARLLIIIPTQWSGRDWGIAIGILMDKWLLCQGAPTSRTESVVKSFEALKEEERDAVVERARQIIAGLSQPGVDSGDGRDEGSEVPDYP
uniref:Putative DNA binding, helix-turn-helix domain containing protein n=1 Tax=viral metagenome TaxID=1070528 RepID=A0A6M3KKH3_9ZZZZ